VSEWGVLAAIYALSSSFDPNQANVLIVHKLRSIGQISPHANTLSSIDSLISKYDNKHKNSP
jgi:hypothetical protein